MVPKIFRIGTTCRFAGPIHEYVTGGGVGELPNEVFFLHKRTEQSLGKSMKRFERDLVLIENFLRENPNEPRYTFYLAQTYECLGNKEKAIEYYGKRYNLKTGYEQERYISALRNGRILKGLGMVPHATEWFLKAFSCRRTRAEALTELAKLYDGDEIYLKYHFASLACNITISPVDKLFIETNMYEYERWNQLSISAWYVGEYEIGLNALLECLKVSNKEHNVKNVKFYKKKMNVEIYNSIISKADEKVILNLQRSDAI